MAGPPDKDGNAAKNERAPHAARPGELAVWMSQFGPALRRFFSRRAPVDEADDLVQEVFVRLQSRADGEPVENIERYLFRIARNVLVSRYRETRAEGAARDGVFDEDMHAPNDLSPERILAGKQEYERALIAILKLPPRTRTAFELHRFDRLSYSAIAQRMGISKGSVQILMQRAIDRLLEDMEDEP